MKKESVGDDNIMNLVIEVEKILSKRKNNKAIEKLKKNYPDKIDELEEVLFEYMVEKGLKTLKTGFSWQI